MFRTNTVAAGTDVHASSQIEAIAERTMRGSRAEPGVTRSRPRPKRQACKGKRRMTRPEPGRNRPTGDMVVLWLTPAQVEQAAKAKATARKQRYADAAAKAAETRAKRKGEGLRKLLAA